MATLSYPRSPLTVLSVRDSSPEEVIGFLNRFSADQSYSLISDDSLSERAIKVRGSRDRTTLIGLLPSYYLVYDPDLGGVQFIYGEDGLHRLGVDPAELTRRFSKLRPQDEDS